MASGEIVGLHRSFRAFAKLGHEPGDGRSISYKQIKEWLLQVNVFTSRLLDDDIASIYEQFQQPRLCYEDFLELIETIERRAKGLQLRPALQQLPNYELLSARSPAKWPKDISYLYQKLVRFGFTDAEYVKILIAENIRIRYDDLESSVTPVSMICPLSQDLVKTPCRSFSCRHLRCFDARTFLTLNVNKDLCVCPICQKTIVYGSLMIDGFFQEILNSPIFMKSGLRYVTIRDDGCWSADPISAAEGADYVYDLTAYDTEDEMPELNPMDLSFQIQDEHNYSYV